MKYYENEGSLIGLAKLSGQGQRLKSLAGQRPTLALGFEIGLENELLAPFGIRLKRQWIPTIMSIWRKFRHF